MDELEPPKPLDSEDPRVEPEHAAEGGAPSTAVVEQQQSVEFDSPDSGLPSSRNYSVASGIQSSIDEGQSVGFEEEYGGGEADASGPAAHVFSEPHDSASRASELEAGEELAAVCAAAYTVCGPSRCVKAGARLAGWKVGVPRLSQRVALSSASDSCFATLVASGIAATGRLTPEGPPLF